MSGNVSPTTGTLAPCRLRQLEHGGRYCVDELRGSGFNEFDEEETNVTILEVSGPNAPLEKRVFRDNASLRGHLMRTNTPRIRIVSIPQFDSYEPLQIGNLAMEDLLMSHDVSSDFLSTLYAAGWPPRESEEGFGHAIKNQYDDSSWDLTYLARYYEKRETSWKLRQTGVYHAYTQSTESHIFILLHPREDSVFQNELEKFVGDISRTSLLVARPMIVHEILFQCYIGNWRAFLKDKGSDFLRSAEKLFALDYKGNHYLDISFEKLQWWRDLEDRIMPSTSILEAALDLLDTLDGLDVVTRIPTPNPAERGLTRPRNQSRFFESRKGVVKAFVTSAGGLKKRIRGAVSLLRDTLELKNQKELAKINSNLLSLQRENVDDNETVKVITVLTLIYLPGSFVATLFGTNLFFFNPSTSRMRVADNAWWYIVIFLPLTVFTIFVWHLKTKSSRRKRANRTAGMQALEAVAADGSMHLQALKNIVDKQMQYHV